MLGKTAGAIGAAAMALMLATPAHADRDTQRYTSLTVFGDSLVDAGNIRAQGVGASPTAGYFMGRFTNGYDYTDLLSQALFGAPTKASLLGGTNFAYGGARASDTTPSIFVKDLSEQLALAGFGTVTTATVDRNGLYVLNFGGNDIFNAPADATAKAVFLQQAAKDYVDGIQTLLDAGARNILFTGFPVLTDPASFTAEGYLTTELARLKLTADDTLYRLSYLDFFTQVSTSPGSLGLPVQRQDITCQAAEAAGTGAFANNCAGIFSFDGIHPTAPVQSALFRYADARFNLTGSVPEPASWAMMILGFGLAGAAMRRRGRAVAAAA